jgi:flagella basal body P-ring formation protein FlgA
VTESRSRTASSLAAILRMVAALSGTMATSWAAATAPSSALPTAQPVAASDMRIDAGDLPAVTRFLVSQAEALLRPARLHIDRQHVWLTLSATLPAAEDFVVRPTWIAADIPPLPLTFELRPRTAGLGMAVQATLAVQLLRDEWVAVRRLRKGSTVSCDDLSLQPRPLRAPERPASKVAGLLSTENCELAPGTTALRDIAAAEVIRSTDVGTPPEITAQMPVRVSVASGGVSLTTIAIALADARLGDELDVRLRNPARILKTRVTGSGSAQLLDGSL